MKKLTVALVAVFALGGVSEAMAQTGQATVVVPQVLTIRSVGDLTITLAAGDFSQTTGTASATGDVTVETMGNVAHSVDVTGGDLMNGAEVFTLQVQDAGDSNFKDVSGTAVRAISGLARGLQTGTATFQATADVASHAPGTYTGTITYTVIAN
jgi:hypothetical protein